MNPLATRLRHMALGWCSVGLVYGTCGVLQGAGTIVPETALDRAIPFSASGIWLYLSFFALVPLAYLLADARRLPWLERAMQMSALASGAVFLLWPTTLHYPPLADASLPASVQRMLIAMDSSQNCLPSLHGALTLLSVWALADARKPLRSLLAAAWGLGVLYATIQTRRHVALDLSAGVAVGVLCGVAASQWLARRARTLSIEPIST
ncbi:phosphatase PAP2 family protein [Ralstonia sp. UBA689]|uniref:phosphatase PAP2 family protein n=1 Tax=Ralstonia sp. UBA689 TaxID=1947373 RepID=UPI0025CF92F0|nr:phosphatase PAP2 family protein [Ralstonia sp. UBA689]